MYQIHKITRTKIEKPISSFSSCLHVLNMLPHYILFKTLLRPLSIALRNRHAYSHIGKIEPKKERKKKKWGDKWACTIIRSFFLVHAFLWAQEEEKKTIRNIKNNKRHLYQCVWFNTNNSSYRSNEHWTMIDSLDVWNEKF